MSTAASRLPRSSTRGSACSFSGFMVSSRQASRRTRATEEAIVNEPHLCLCDGGLCASAPPHVSPPHGDTFSSPKKAWRVRPRPSGGTWGLHAWRRTVAGVTTSQGASVAPWGDPARPVAGPKLLPRRAVCSQTPVLWLPDRGDGALWRPGAGRRGMSTGTPRPQGTDPTDADPQSHLTRLSVRVPSEGNR